MSKGFGSTMYLYNNLGFLVLCQEKVQIKCNQFSLCLAKLNLLFLSHYLLDFSDILPHIGLGINTRNGCEYVLYCKMFLLQLLFAINWSRLFKEILLLMLLYGGAFFEKRGNKTVKEQQVERQGIFLTNYVMIKE